MNFAHFAHFALSKCAKCSKFTTLEFDKRERGVIMTITEKKEIVDNILELLIQLTDDSSVPLTTQTVPQTNKPVEMLTIKECTDVVQGLSEHTVRQLVAQKKVKSIRTGEGKRGKILVNKADLIAYFQK
jgi:hypothetical protein